MNPTENQQPVSPVPSVPVGPIVSSPAPAPEQVGNPVPKTEKKFLFYGILLGLFVVAIIGVGVFYMVLKPKSSEQVAVIPTPAAEVVSTEPTPVEVAEVEGVGDLDNLIVGLAEADGNLDKELVALEKDANF